MLTTVLFYSFATILVLLSLAVITTKNAVHAALYLVVAFITSACLWLLLNVEFLALVLIVVYVGAVMVLFLFVVMMLNIDVEAMRKGFWRNLPLALVLGVVVLLEMLLVVISKPISLSSSDVSLSASTATTTSLANGFASANHLGMVLYSDYYMVVELASMILLLGLVVAVALTLRKHDKSAKTQNIAAQIKAQASDRVTLVQFDKN